MHPPNPDMRKAALADRPVRKPIPTETTLPENAHNLQALRLVSKFGFAFETAVVVAALAWGIAR